MKPGIASAFASGRLIRPAPSQPDLIHLVRALGALCGAESMADMEPTRHLMELIGPAEHIVFVLLDGMGMNIVRPLKSNSFIRSHLIGQILAPCPSTTACALTSIATGDWPARHGVTGWFTYLPQHGLTITTLPFVERFSQQPLAARGMTVQSVLPLAAFYPRMTRRTLTLMPAPICNTTYAVYSRGDTPAAGYSSVPDSVSQVVAEVNAAREPTYTHLYIPDVDTACHHRGVGNPSVMTLMNMLDDQLARLAEETNGKARIVISADHGLIDVPITDHMSMFPDDPLLKLLEAPASGDARLPVFHVRPGKTEDFEEGFHQRFGHSMLLLASEEAAQMNLFGPGEMSAISRRRFGDFIGIAHRAATLHYVLPSPSGAAHREPYLAQHAGLSPDEMEIPLILA